MRRTYLSAATLIVVFVLPLSGCHSAEVSLASPRPSPTAALPGKPSGATSSAPLLSRPAKHPARDPEFTTYHNPVYGVSFRYPRNYALQEGLELDDSPLLHRQQELAAAQPEAVLVAKVSIPEDAYPNTTFRSGWVQLLVRPTPTPEACRSLAVPADSTGPGFAAPSMIGTLSIHGIPFDWWLRGGADAGTRLEDVTYIGYMGGTCYEFLIEVTAGNTVEPDSGARPADTAKILHALEKIVFSFAVQPKAEPPSRSN